LEPHHLGASNFARHASLRRRLPRISTHVLIRNLASDRFAEFVQSFLYCRSAPFVRLVPEGLQSDERVCVGTDAFPQEFVSRVSFCVLAHARHLMPMLP